MKRILAVLLTLVVFVSLATSCNTVGVTEGEFAQFSYVNRSIDLVFHRMNDWKFCTDEELQEIYDSSSMDENVSIEFMAYSTRTGSSVICSFSRMSLSERFMPTESYALVFAAGLEKTGEKLAYECKAPIETTLAGHECMMVEAASSDQNGYWTQYVYLYPIGDTMVTITCSSRIGELTATFEKMFSDVASTET